MFFLPSLHQFLSFKVSFSKSVKLQFFSGIMLICMKNILSSEVDFQYQCYKSLCTFPLEYCSSNAWERRCIPCLPSVCQSKSVPLGCIFNCSNVIATLKKSETLKNSSDITPGIFSIFFFLKILFAKLLDLK